MQDLRDKAHIHLGVSRQMLCIVMRQDDAMGMGPSVMYCCCCILLLHIDSCVHTLSDHTRHLISRVWLAEM